MDLGNHQHRCVFDRASIFAPHVETSAGIILPDEYLRTVSTLEQALDEVIGH